MGRIKGGKKRQPKLQMRIEAWEQMRKTINDKAWFAKAFRKPGSQKK